MILFTMPAISQVKVDFPGIGNTDISIHPEIRIKLDSGYKFDTSKLDTFIYSKNLTYDTTTNTLDYGVLFLFRQDIYDGVTDSSLVRSIVLGSRLIVDSVSNNNEIFLTPFSTLEYNMEFGLHIEDLRVIDLNQDTVLIDTTINNYFTTINETEKITGLSLNNGKGVSCNDSITIYFNRKINSFENSNGDKLIELSTITNESVINDEIVASDSLITINHQFNIDSTILKIWPSDQFEVNSEYVLNINLGMLTGDSTDNYSQGFPTNQGSNVKMFSSGYDFPPNELPTGAKGNIKESGYFLRFGDTLGIVTPKEIEGYLFNRWLYGDGIVVADDSSFSTSMYLTCEVKQECSIVAEYRKIPIDTLVITNPTHPTSGLPISSVEVSNFKDSLGNGIYTIYRNSQSCTFLTATSLNNQIFKEWETNDSFDGDSTNGLCIGFSTNSYDFAWGPNARREFEPTWEPKPTNKCPNFTINVKVVNEEFQNIDISTILSSIFVDLKEGTNTQSYNLVRETAKVATGSIGFSDPYPTPFKINFEIELPGCWEVSHYNETSHGLREGGTGPEQGLGQEITTKDILVDTYDNNCSLNLVVYIRKKLNVLYTERRMIEGSEIPNNNAVMGLFVYNPDFVQAEDSPEYTYDGNGDLKVIKEKFYVKCGENVKVQPFTKANSGYKDNIWVCPTQGRPETLNLTCSSVISDPTLGDNVLSFTADDDITYVRHDFEELFKLEEIGFMDIDKPGYYKYFDVDGDYQSNDAPIAAMDILGTARGINDPMGATYKYSTSSIKLVFNRPIDPATLRNNIVIRDRVGPNTNKRYDGRTRREYTYTPSLYGGVDYISSRGGTNDNEVTIFFYDTKEFLEMPHMNPFEISLNENVKSSTGAKLDNYISKYTSRTEYPAYEIKFKSFEVGLPYLTSHLNEDLFIQYYANYDRVDDPTIALGMLNHEYGEQLPPDNPKEVTFGDRIYNVSHTLNTVPRLSVNSYVGIGYHIVEDHAGTTFKNFGDIENKTTDKAANTKPNVWTFGTFLRSASASYMYAHVLGELLEWLSIDDRSVDNFSERYNKSDHLWDCEMLYHPTNIQIAAENGRNVNVNFESVLK